MLLITIIHQKYRFISPEETYPPTTSEWKRNDDRRSIVSVIITNHISPSPKVLSMTTILSVLVVAACWVVALCHDLPKASLFWARGGAGADKVVLRVRAPDGAVSRLTLENVLTIGDIVQEISKLIRAEMLNDVEVSIKHDPAQSIGNR